MTASRVMLVDDHQLVRSSIRAILEPVPEIDIVAETGDGREAIQLIALHHPDVVLMDIAMPEVSGLDVTAEIARTYPSSKVIILTMHANVEYQSQAIAAGAKGYVLKSSSVEEFRAAVKAVASGQHYYCLSSEYIFANDELARSKDQNSVQLLTPREREVLQLIAEGRTAKQIAEELKISVKTVETHRANLMQRLGIHDIAGLVRYALRVGLTKME